MTETGHRIFIAVPLHLSLHAAVESLERRIESAGVSLRWVKPENLHFTLRFLGHITPAQLTRARAATRAAADGVSSFRIRLAGIGVFPSVRRPQVVWVGITEGADELRDLAGRLDDTLARQRFPKEPRRFVAHLTLARVRSPHEQVGLGVVVATLSDLSVGEQAVTSLVVMESLLRPSGALHTPVEEVPLSPYEK